MSTAYASVTDVQDRLLREITEDEEAVCEKLLEDASTIIDATSTEAEFDVKKLVTVRMVMRVIGNADVSTPIGATQGSMSANGYTQSWTVGSGVTGELYLSKTDKKLLGLGNGIGSHSPLEDM